MLPICRASSSWVHRVLHFVRKKYEVFRGRGTRGQRSSSATRAGKPKRSFNACFEISEANCGPLRCGLVSQQEVSRFWGRTSGVCLKIVVLWFCGYVNTWTEHGRRGECIVGGWLEVQIRGLGRSGQIALHLWIHNMFSLDRGCPNICLCYRTCQRVSKFCKLFLSENQNLRKKRFDCIPEAENRKKTEILLFFFNFHTFVQYQFKRSWHNKHVLSTAIRGDIDSRGDFDSLEIFRQNDESK